MDGGSAWFQVLHRIGSWICTEVESKMAGCCRSSPRSCVASSRHGVSRHTRTQGFPRFRPSSQCNRKSLPVKSKGRANLRVVAVEENPLEAKVSNVTFDMAQAMTDVATVTSDVEVLQKEVASLRTDLNRLGGAVEMLRASGDRLDNHVSRYLESYETYNDKHRKPIFFLIILVLVLDLVLETFILVDFFKTWH